MFASTQSKKCSQPSGVTRFEESSDDRETRGNPSAKSGLFEWMIKGVTERVEEGTREIS